MNADQYAQLTQSPAAAKVLRLVDLQDQTPRTLIFGYTCNRETFHVYIGKDHQLHVLLYSPIFDNESSDRFYILQHFEEGGQTDNHGFVPNKRVYPESCDFEFCRLLQTCDVNIPFTTFDPQGYEKRLAANGGVYAGLTHDSAGAHPMVDLYAELREVSGKQHSRRRVAEVVMQLARNWNVPFIEDFNSQSTTYVSAKATADIVKAARAELV
jgi:hypothetical protein